MILDYHIHTTRCGHAEGTMAEYVEKALERGLKEIGFSDHLPLSPAPEGTWSCDWAMQETELQDYKNDVLKLRDVYPEITIKLGIEADFFPEKESIAKTKALLQLCDWDYVIGSVHHVGPWPIDSSLYLTEFEKRDLYKTYEEYFSLVIEAAHSGIFDIMGHLDVIKKYGYRPKEDLSSLYIDVAKELKKSGMVFEINTSGLRKIAKEIYPAPLFVKELVEAKVPVTLGSDSHSPDEVGKDFDYAVSLLKSLGVDEIASFSKRKKVMVSL